MSTSNNRIIFSITILLGILSMLLLLIVNPVFLEYFTADGVLEDYYREKIAFSQKALIIEGLILIAIGLLGYQARSISFLNRSERLTNVFLLIIFFFWALIQGEIVLRVKPLPSTNESLDRQVPAEPSAFSRNVIPQNDVDVLNINGAVLIKLRNGYHGEPFPVIKPEGELRIVMIGGSFVFSSGDYSWNILSNPDINWVNEIQTKLRSKGFSRIRIINAGIPSHASFDSFGRLYSEIHFFDPDCVVLCHGWNDMKNFKNISPDNTLLRLVKPLSKPSHKYVVGLEELFENSQIYLQIKQLISSSNSGYGREGLIPEESYSDSYSPFAMVQLKLTLELFVDLCKNIGAIPVIASQPRLVTETNTPEDRAKIAYNYQALTHKAICKAYSEIDSVMEEVSLRKNALFFDLAKEFSGNGDLFIDHVHLSIKGGNMVSSAVAEFIEQNILEKDTATAQNVSQFGSLE